MIRPFEEKQFYTPKQVAECFGYHVKTIRKKVRDGEIHFFVDKGRMFFLGADLNMWCASMRIERRGGAGLHWEEKDRK